MVIHDRPPRPTVLPPGWGDPDVASGLPSSPLRRWGPLLLWLGCLLTALVLLRWLGAGRLATPPVAAPRAWASWVAEGDPFTVAMAILRVFALGLAWYLTGVTGISVLARVLRAARLVRVADALSFGPVRVLAQQAVGVGLAAGVLVSALPQAPSVPDAASAGPTDVAVMVPVADDPAARDATTIDAVAAAPAGLALRDGAPVPVPAPALPATVAEEAPAADVGDVGARERVVRAGDHFWSIAEDEVRRHVGRTGTDDEVLAHWEVLVDANAERLVVSGNPDLLLPGQRIVLPEVGS